MADPITSMYPAGHAIDTLKIVNPAPSVDPAMLALMGNKDSGLFGGGGNGLLALLIGAFLFGGRGGLLGGAGAGHGGAGAFAAEAVAAQSIFTPKDTSLQLSSFQNWAQNNAAQLAQQCCCSTQQVIAAVNGVSDKMFQTFVAQSQAQTAQMNNMQSTLTAQATVNHDAVSAHLNTMEDNLNNDVHDLEKTTVQGFAAGQLAECQTQNLVNSTSAAVSAAIHQAITSGNYALARQLADCCCENRLAIANQNALIERNTAQLSNQVNLQTCEIKSAISADGQTTRALINANRTEDLQAQLNDAKSAVRDAAIIAQINRRCHGCGETSGNNGNGNGNS